MFKNIRKTIVGLIGAAMLVALPVAVPAMASAASGADIQNCLSQGTGLDASGSGNDCTPASTSTSTDKINGIIKTVINVFSIVVGVVAVIMIIIGGFRYITSGGDSSNVSGAKNTIIYAIIGLVVVALAQFIVQFVVNKVTQ